MKHPKREIWDWPTKSLSVDGRFTRSIKLATFFGLSVIAFFMRWGSIVLNPQIPSHNPEISIALLQICYLIYQQIKVKQTNNSGNYTFIYLFLFFVLQIQPLINTYRSCCCVAGVNQRCVLCETETKNWVNNDRTLTMRFWGFFFKLFSLNKKIITKCSEIYLLTRKRPQTHKVGV